MVNSLDPQSQQFLAGLDILQQRAARAQQQITSGTRVATAADAPASISQILNVESNLQVAEQVSTNLGRVKSEVDTGESGLETAVQVIQQALTIGTQGASGTTSADQRSVLADQLQHLHEQLVQISNTTVEGRYIFGGDADGSAPYQVNLTQANGVDRLTTASATKRVQNPDGTSFGVSETAQQIFDHRNPDDSLAEDNVFQAVNSLRLALQANDQAAITVALSRLQVSSDYLNRQLASYGNAQNLVASAIDSASKLQVRWTVRLSDLRDTDQTSAILELTQTQTATQAALSAEGQRPRTSLFDYLR